MKNRDIKFRAWDEEAELWRYFTLEDAIIGRLVRRDGRLVFPRISKECQFTGLKDKNGKEIYEGDIVQWSGGKGEVYFDEARFWVRSFSVSFFDDPSDAFGEGLGRLEVIGNIYEHSQLLK